MLRCVCAALASLSLAGCGNLCDRYDSVSASFQTKHQACNVSDSTSFNKATCNENLAQCTAADQEKLNKYMDCVEKIPACTSDTKLAFAEAVMNCATNSELENISSACQAL
jgi:hypothetical protein